MLVGTTSHATARAPQRDTETPATQLGVVGAAATVIAGAAAVGAALLLRHRGAAGTALPSHQIRAQDVDAFLATSAIKQPYIHASTPAARDRIRTHGVESRFDPTGLYGVGLYTSKAHHKAYGDATTQLAIRMERPFETTIDDFHRDARSIIDDYQLRHPHEPSAIAHRNALVEAGYDGIHMAGDRPRNDWLVSFDPKNVRVVVDAP